MPSNSRICFHDFNCGEISQSTLSGEEKKKFSMYLNINIIFINFYQKNHEDLNYYKTLLAVDLVYKFVAFFVVHLHPEEISSVNKELEHIQIFLIITVSIKMTFSLIAVTFNELSGNDKKEIEYGQFA